MKKLNILNNFAYRIRDVCLSLFGLIVLSPLMIFIGFWVKTDSPGKAIYKGNRSGRRGKDFWILKFRTMYESPESYNGNKITAEGDPRITPIGKWLRNTKLNELPQLWNVLIGEMSLVGPRPEDPDIVKGWQEEIKNEILSVRPGITSPASVLFRDEESLLNIDNVEEHYINLVQPSKLRLDQLYVRHRSFWQDLDVLLWTFLILFPNNKKVTPPEDSLFAGPLFKFRFRQLNWFLIDSLAVFLSFVISGIFWRTFGPLQVGLTLSVVVTFGFALIFSLCGSIFGLHKNNWDKASANEVWSILAASTVSSIIAVWINWRLRYFPHQVIFLASILTFLGFVIIRYRTRLLTGFASRIFRFKGKNQTLGERVLIVGCGDAGQFASWYLENNKNSINYNVIGFIDDDIFKSGTKVRGKKVIGNRNNIIQIVKEQDIGIILFAIHNIADGEQKQLMDICKSTSAKIVVLPNVMAHFNSSFTKEISGINNSNLKNNASEMSSTEISKRLGEIKKDLKDGNTTEGMHKIDRMRAKFNYQEERKYD